MHIDLAAFNDTTSAILGALIDVHRTIGPGLLESTYSACAEVELSARQIPFVRQHTVPIVYKGTTLDAAYRVDLIVDGKVIVEIKSVAVVLPIHEAQVITYLRLTGCPIGLLVNFNVPRLVDGVRRLVNPRRTPN